MKKTIFISAGMFLMLTLLFSPPLNAAEYDCMCSIDFLGIEYVEELAEAFEFPDLDLLGDYKIIITSPKMDIIPCPLWLIGKPTGDGEIEINGRLCGVPFDCECW